MEPTSQYPNNLQRLQKAGLINKDCRFPDAEKALIESLTRTEVDSLIAIADKLGRDFLRSSGGGPSCGILF